MTACSEVIDDLAILTPRPLGQSGRTCPDSPVRAALFTLETLDWLVAVAHELCV